MKSLRRFEGYYQIDHRASPGNAKAPEGQQFESAVFTCAHSHCGGKVVIMNPNRSRPRGYCPTCDRMICDTCEAARLISGCTSLDRLFEKLAKEAFKKEALEKLRIL